MQEFEQKILEQYDIEVNSMTIIRMRIYGMPTAWTEWTASGYTPRDRKSTRLNSSH